MKKIFLVLIWATYQIIANDTYIEQIQVVDRCTRLVEPLTIQLLGIDGVNANGFEAQKAIRACEESLEKNPDDPHVQFLLARAYTKGTSIPSGMHIPERVKSLIPELNDVLPQYERGYFLAKKSCENGDLGGCTLLGYYSHMGVYKHKYSSKKTYLLWLWGCSLGNPQACQNLSGIVEKGNFVPKDLKPDYLYAFDACKSGLYPRACSYYSDQIALGKFQQNKNIDLYVNYRACIAGNKNACMDLEKILDINTSNSKEEKLNFAIKSSCNNGNAKACERLGEMYAKMPRNKINNLMASTFFEDGCNNGEESFSCWYAGNYKIYEGKGIVQDISLGLSYWEKSCYLGMNAFACYDLAQFYIYTNEAKYKNIEKAIKPLEHACRQGNYKSAVLGCEQGIERCCQSFK